MFQALVLPVEGNPVFIIRQLEYFNFVANTFIADAAIYQDNEDPIAFLTKVLADKGLQGKRVAIDKRGWFLPIVAYESMQQALGVIGDAAGIVESLRVVKSPLELGKLERAATYVDAGINAGAAAVRLGHSENDLVAAMMEAAIAAGSEYMGMEPLVSSGPRSGVPHGTWKRRRLQPGDPVLLEMAGCHDRYHAALIVAFVNDGPFLILLRIKVTNK